MIKMENNVFELQGKSQIESFLEDEENQLFYINKKTTRVGATTSYTKYLCEYAEIKDKKLLILEPTNAIIEGTVLPANSDIYWLKKNEDLCVREDIKDRYKQFINVFGYLPVSISICNSCDHQGACERREVDEKISENNLIATTYAKV